MSYQKTYSEILEMIGKALLDTQMCRDIVRRAGLRPSSVQGGNTGTLSLWNGINYSAQTQNFGSYSGQNIPAGAYLFPPFASPPTLQHTVTNLTKVSHVRAIATWPDYNELVSRVAFVPVYSNTLSPTVSSDWLVPDGTTLLQWDSDLVAGTETWPPSGAALDPIGSTTAEASPTTSLIRGLWAPPPFDVLSSRETVLIGVGALIRGPHSPLEGDTVTVDINQVELQAAISPTSDAFNAHYFGA